MKNTVIILLLSMVTFSAFGQSWKEKRAEKKAEKIERAEIATKNNEVNFYKVGHHLRNAGWSFLGSVLTLPYAIAGNSSMAQNSQTPPTRFQEISLSSITLGSIFLVCNTGAQVIKAGWELKKVKKE